MAYNVEINEHPGALAYARLRERQIVVYYSRILQWRLDYAPCVVAYLLAHEIAHVVQRTGVHSERGIMQASWSRNDYADMVRGGLGFTRDNQALDDHVLTTAPAELIPRNNLTDLLIDR
jgi:hypothetical protein